jgi:hypothetical protein
MWGLQVPGKGSENGTVVFFLREQGGEKVWIWETTEPLIASTR